MQEIVRNSFFVSASGGVIDYLSSDGELLLQIAVPAGRVPVSEYLDLCPYGAEMQISEGLFCAHPRSFNCVQSHHLSEETGANPDFEPSSAANQERRLQMLVSRMTAESVEKTVAARMAGLAQIERVPAPELALIEDKTGSEVVEP